MHLSRHGLRCTRQRVAVYEVLACDASHPTAERLHECVRDEDTGVSLAAVYNNPDGCCTHGIAAKLASAPTGGCAAARAGGRGQAGGAPRLRRRQRGGVWRHRGRTAAATSPPQGGQRGG